MRAADRKPRAPRGAETSAAASVGAHAGDAGNGSFLGLPVAGSTAAIATQSVNRKVTELVRDFDRFRCRLLRAGMPSVSLFFFDLSGSADFDGVPCAALATDAHALYVAWCRRLAAAPARLPIFVRELQLRHQVRSQRLRYHLGGKRFGPHGVLLFGGTTLRLDAQLARFRTVAQSIGQGRFRD